MSDHARSTSSAVTSPTSRRCGRAVRAAGAQSVLVDARDDNEALALTVAVDHLNRGRAPRGGAAGHEQAPASSATSSPRVHPVQWHTPRMITEELQDPGITQVYTDLMTDGGGGNTYSVRLPDSVGPMTFGECQTMLGRDHAALALAARGDDGLLVSPPWDTPLAPGTVLYYVSRQRLTDRAAEPTREAGRPMSEGFSTEVLVLAPVERVWRALRDPAEIRLWHGWDEPGLDAEIQFIYADHATETDEPYVLVVEPLETFTLDPHEDGTVVRPGPCPARSRRASGPTATTPSPRAGSRSCSSCGSRSSGTRGASAAPCSGPPPASLRPTCSTRRRCRHRSGALVHHRPAGRSGARRPRPRAAGRGPPGHAASVARGRWRSSARTTSTTPSGPRCGTGGRRGSVPPTPRPTPPAEAAPTP